MLKVLKPLYHDFFTTDVKGFSKLMWVSTRMYEKSVWITLSENIPVHYESFTNNPMYRVHRVEFAHEVPLRSLLFD